MSGSCSCAVSFSLVFTVLLLALLHTSLKWMSLIHLSHLLPYAGHHHSMYSSLQYLHLLLVLNVFVVSYVCVLDIFLYNWIKVFVSCKLLITAVWTLWASILFAQASTFSLYGNICFTFCQLCYNFC